MHKILITVFFLIVSSISVNAAPYLEELLGWQIRSVFHESSNTYSCYYAFRGSNFNMAFIYNDNTEFSVIVTSAEFIKLTPLPNADTTYTVELNGQKVLGSTAFYVRPGIMFIAMPYKDYIEANITNTSKLQISNNQKPNVKLEFPIAPNYKAARSKAVECYNTVTSSLPNNKKLLEVPNPLPDSLIPGTTLKDIRDRNAQTVSRFSDLSDITPATASLFSYFMGDLQKTFTITSGIKTVGYENDTLYGLFIISNSGTVIESNNLISIYKRQIFSANCKTINVGIVNENKNGFLLNYMSRCSGLSEKYYSMGYVLYSSKTKQILEFSNLTTEKELPRALPIMDILRMSLNSFISSNGNGLSTY